MAQPHSNCGGAFYKMTPADSCNLQSFFVEGDQREVWSVFSATDTAHSVSLFENQSLPSATITHVILFAGTCSNLTRLDSISFNGFPSFGVLSNLNPGTDYYLCFGRDVDTDCPSGICPEQSGFDVCLRERVPQLGINWDNGGGSGFCYDVSNNPTTPACTIRVCINNPVILEGGEVATSPLPPFGISIDVFASPVSWFLAGSNWVPQNNPVIGPITVFYSQTGFYTSTYNSFNGIYYFVVEVVDIPPPTNLTFNLDDVVCPGGFLEVTNLSASGIVDGFFISASPSVPVNGTTIGPFAAGQTYDVTVTAYNACGAVSETVQVTPDYQISFTHNVSCTTVNLAASSPCETSVTYNWDLGDGAQLNFAGPAVAHVYAAPGTYTVNVDVFTTSFPTQFLGSFSQTIIVEGIPSLSFTWQENCGVVSFFPSVRCDDFIVGWQWDFGNGQTSNQYFPTPVTYAASGTYTVVLSALHANGQVYSTQQVISVTSAPIPAILEGPLNFCCSELIFTVNDDYVSYVWDVQDPLNLGYSYNLISSNQIEVFVLSADESLDVCVTVVDANGCEQTICFHVSNDDCCPGPLAIDPEDPYLGFVNPSEIVVITDGCAPTLISTLTDVFGTLLPPSYNFQEQYVVLNHDLIIDVDMKFEKANIRVLGPFKIVVLDGVKAEFEACNIEAKCQFRMWKGIVLENSGSELIISGGSIVKHAEEAVQAFGGAPFSISTTQFINNWIGIQAIGLPTGQYPANINNCIFATILPVGSNTILFPPYHTEVYGLAGVNLIGINTMQIGSTGALGGNTFSNLKYGITGQLSGATIFNNTFNNIVSINGIPQTLEYKAIYFTNGLPISRQLVVGGSLAQQNTFNNVNIGVHTAGRVNSTIERNTITQFLQYGIWLQRNPSTTTYAGSHTVRNNTIRSSQGDVGILAQDNNSSLLDIRLNNINSPANPNYFMRLGIFVSQVSPAVLNSNVVANVNFNTVRQTQAGIVGLNVPYIRMNDNTVSQNITNATLNANTMSYLGMGMFNCTAGEAGSNRVTRVGGNPNNEDKLTGIGVESSLLAFVHDNTVEAWGKGIEVSANNLNSRLYCNTLRRNYYGFKFNNAVIGKQGEPSSTTYPAGLASDNKWIANQGPHRSEGVLDVNAFSPTNWYVRNGQINDPDPSSLLENNYQFTAIPLSGNPTSSCSVGGPIGPAPTPRSRMFGGIANGTNAYGQFLVDQVYWEATNTTRFFAADTAWLHQDPTDDVVYQQFYNTQRNSNTGRLMDAESSLSVLDTLSAQNICAATSPNCQKEDNLLAVYQLAATRYLSETTTLDGADTTWLEYVACLDPLTEGAAVYSARAMLVWPFGCEYDMRSMQQVFNDITVIATDVEVLVFPNPAASQLFIESSKDINRLKVYDMLGKQVHVVDGVNLSKVVLELETLTQGVYLLVTEGDDFKVSTKFIKQ